MTHSRWFTQVIRGEYVLKYVVWSGTGMEQVWNGHGTDTQRNFNFETLRSLVWNGGLWNGFVDLFRISRSGCAFPLVPDQSY